MIAPCLRGPFGMTLRRCLANTWPVAVAAMVSVLLLHAFLSPELGERGSAGAASPWLLLALFALQLAAGITAVTFWPPFAARRPGRDQVLRLQRGRLHGAGAATLAALSAQLLLSLPLVVSLPALLGAPPAAHANVALATPDDTVLLADAPPLRLAVPPDLTFGELHLRPLAALPEGATEATRVEVRVDGELLLPDALSFVETRQLRRATFAARSGRTLELHAVAGTVPLWFPRGSVVLVGTTAHPRWLNGVLTAALALLPTSVALAFALLLGRFAALPTVLAVVASTIFVQTIGEVGPFADSARILMRGQWLATSGVFTASIPSLLVGSFAMIVVMCLPVGSRR